MSRKIDADHINCAYKAYNLLVHLCTHLNDEILMTHYFVQVDAQFAFGTFVFASVWMCVSAHDIHSSCSVCTSDQCTQQCEQKGVQISNDTFGCTVLFTNV